MKLISVTTKKERAIAFLFKGSEYSIKKLITPKLGITLWFIYRGARTQLSMFFIWADQSKPMLEAMFKGYLEAEGSRMTYLEFCQAVYKKEVGS